MRFFQEWYRRCVTIDQIPAVFSAWRETEWKDGTPSLVFTRPPGFTPWIRRTVEVVDITDAHGGSKIAELRFEILNNLTPPWHKKVPISEIAKLIADFLSVDTPQERLYVDLGPTIKWWERLRR